MKKPSFTIGIDYGSNSVRALVVRCHDGKEFGSAVFNYPSGTQGILLDPKDFHLARQHPGDYLLGLEKSVKGALAAASKQPGFSASKVIGLGVDTTGSSPIPVDRKNRALAQDPKWKKNLYAQCWLWKDHTAWEEAARITELAAKHRPGYIAKCGNTYSSEWWWSKIWRCLQVAPKVFDAAYSWVELADWIPSVLAGVEDPLAVKRGICAAGHKALYSDEWEVFPTRSSSRCYIPSSPRSATASTTRPTTQPSPPAASVLPGQGNLAYQPAYRSPLVNLTFTTALSPAVFPRGRW